MGLRSGNTILQVCNNSLQPIIQIQLHEAHQGRLSYTLGNREGCGLKYFLVCHVFVYLHACL